MLTDPNTTIGGTGAGEANTIAFNTSDGIFLDGAATDGHKISGNSIHSNGGLGIDIGPDGVGTGSGANNNKPRPTISSITPSGGNFTAVATVTSGDTIEFFRVNNTASPAVTADVTGSGEGYLYLGKCVDNGACSGPYISAVADANGAGGTVQATLLASGLTSSDLVTATATDAVNGTSEFAANVAASLCPGSVVTTTANTGSGSLSECINYANAVPGTTISFNIPNTDPNYTNGGSGSDYWWRISPSPALPQITASNTVIDGISQTTNRGNTNTLGPEIEIEGSGAGAGAHGLRLAGGNGNVKGLVINSFGGYGVYISTNSGNVVAGCYIGTDYAGAVLLGNTSGGMYVNSNSNIIGGTTAAERNVISGNNAAGSRGIYFGSSATAGNVVKGNFIGVNATGTAALPNQEGVRLNGTNTLIGGNTPADRNIISGNVNYGVILSAAATSGITISGNYIGTDATGAAPIPNGNGVWVVDASNSTIGGASAAGNVISGNSSYGIRINNGPISNITVSGNIIGLKADQSAALGNGSDGIYLNIPSSSTIGGTAAGSGNTISGNGGMGINAQGGSGNSILFNNIYANTGGGILAKKSDLTLAGNLIRNHGGASADGIQIATGGAGTYIRVYHNTIHGNGRDGVQINDTGAILKNNIITGNGAYGINRVTAAMTESYNLVTDAATTPSNASGQSNVALDVTDLNKNPLYTNAGGGDFTLQGSSLAISRGCNLGGAGADTGCDNASDSAQIDLTSGANPNFYGYAPDIGAFETTNTTLCPVSTTADASPTAPYGSLRACITYANASPGRTVSFSIGGAGNQSSGADSWWRISPVSVLPTITAASTIIDGTTQTTNMGNTNTLGPEIEIYGAGAGAGVDGLTLTGGTSTARSLVINSFTNNGIKLDVNDGNTIVGNYIGTDATGTADLGNTWNGIYIYWHSGSNIIGTSAAVDRNILSGNNGAGVFTHWSDGNIIKGNYIGTNALGTAAIGNTGAGVDIYSKEAVGGNIIGGSAANEGNVISGNTGYGIYLDTGPINSIIKGNKIGTQANGTVALANAWDGIFGGGTGHQIGGAAAGEGNVISGNTQSGIYFQGSSSFIQGNFIGTDTSSTVALGNLARGVRMDSIASNNTIGGTVAGAGNVIANNSSVGVSIEVSGATGNSILGNAIYANGNLGIDLSYDGLTVNDANDVDTGGNNKQNFPVLSSALTNGTNSVTISGTLNSIASTNFRIEFFASTVADASGYGEAQRYLGFVNTTTDGSNNASFSQNLVKAVAVGEFITATATNLTTNDTSEFALNVTATAMVTISGTVYTDEGTTNIGAGKTVRLVVGGVSAGTAVTAAGGTYSIDSGVALPANTPFLVYVDGDAKKGTTVGASTGSNLSGINIYAGNSDATGDGYVIVRHDNGGSMTSALMSTALGAYSDTDIKYTVPAGVLTVGTYNYLYVPAGHTFAPGANTSLDSVNILGAFTGGASTHTVAGHWNAATGTYTANTSTVSFLTRASTMNFTPGASSYYNIMMDTNDKQFALQGNVTATNDVTFKSTGAGTGVLATGTRTISTKNFIWQSGYILQAAGAVIECSSDFTKTGGGYALGNGAGLAFRFVGSGNSTFTPGSGTHGSIAVSKDTQSAVVTLSTNNLVMASSQSLNINTGIFDLAGRNLDIGGGSTFSNTGTLRLQGGETVSPSFNNDVDSGTVEYNGSGGYTGLPTNNAYYHLRFNGAGSWTLADVLVVAGDITIAGGTLNAAGNLIDLVGNWSNSGIFTHGNGTVEFNGTNQSISGNTTFNNLTKSVASADTLTFAAGSTTTINGTATLNGAAGQLLSLRSNTPGTRWNFVLNSGATKAISYVDVQDSNASSSAIALKPVNPPNSVSSGNNLAWFLGIGGTVYIDEGVTNIGAGKTVRLLINGASASTATTDVNGAYSIETPSLAANDALLVYVDNDASYKGTTVTVSNGADLSTLDIYAANTITRQDNGGALSNANMSTALGAYSDADILYSVSGSDLTVSGAITELYVPTGHTFTPGGNVSTVHVKVLGTMNGGANTFNVSGNWDSSVGTWNAGTSTVSLTGTGSVAQYTVATPWNYGFNNLSLAAAGQTTTLASTNLWVQKLTIGSGTLTDGPNNYDVILQGTGDVFVDGGGVLAIGAFYYRVGNGTQNVVGRDYSTVNTLGFYGVGGGGYTNLYSMQGNLTAKTIKINSNNSYVPGYNAPSVLNTNNYSITATGLEVGRSGQLNDYGRLNAGSSSITINGPVTIFASDASGANEINAGSSQWAVSASWTNYDIFTPGTSTVTLNGTNQSITGNTAFNNLTKSAVAAATLTFAAGSTTTISGTATLTCSSCPADQYLSLRSGTPGSRWNFILPASSTKAISYVDVQDSDASGSDASKKPVNPTNSIDSGNTLSWFANLEIVKQLWEENGTAPLASPAAAPVGSTVVFLIYVKNIASGAISDIRINDSLDEAGFEYLAGSLIRTSAATPPADTATDKQIFDATAAGTGTSLSDAADADIASAQDTAGPAGVDRITMGAVPGQVNGGLTINGNTAFALRFKVRVR